MKKPTKKLPWYRFYTDMLGDPKLRLLPPAQRWLWAAILALARQSPVEGVLLVTEDAPITEGDLAILVDMKAGDVKQGLKAFQAEEMLHFEDGVMFVTNWAKRQFQSDDSKARVQRYRERLRNGQSDSLPPLQ